MNRTEKKKEKKQAESGFVVLEIVTHRKSYFVHMIYIDIFVCQPL